MNLNASMKKDHDSPPAVDERLWLRHVYLRRKETGLMAAAGSSWLLRRPTAEVAGPDAKHGEGRSPPLPPATGRRLGIHGSGPIV